MAGELHIGNDQFQYIARISHGKDSLNRLPQRSDGAAIIRGWPMRKMPWCQHLKTDIKDPNKRGKAVEYIGIAADEPKRHGQLNERKRAPLVEFGIEEDLCGLYCKYQGILGPSYENSCRDGCWMCHNQGVNQLRQLRKEYPELWSIMLAWDRDSPWSFKQPSRGGQVIPCRTTKGVSNLKTNTSSYRETPASSGRCWTAISNTDFFERMVL